jgi:predicted transcriptional regulator
MASSINIPDDLLARVEQAAAKEQLSSEELVVVAVEEHLRRKRLQDLYARGERRTRELGIPENRVDAIVREERDQAKLGR